MAKTAENDRLAGEVRALAEKLKISPPPNTDGFSNEQLNETLTELRKLETEQTAAGRTQSGDQAASSSKGSGEPGAGAVRRSSAPGGSPTDQTASARTQAGSGERSSTTSSSSSGAAGTPPAPPGGGIGKDPESAAMSHSAESQRPILNGEAEEEEKRKSAAARASSGSGTTTPSAAESDEPAEYVIEDGKSITVRDGEMRSAGQPISERDLAGGLERINELVKAGYIKRNEPVRRQQQPTTDVADLPKTNT